MARSFPGCCFPYLFFCFMHAHIGFHGACMHLGTPLCVPVQKVNGESALNIECLWDQDGVADGVICCQTSPFLEGYMTNGVR